MSEFNVGDVIHTIYYNKVVAGVVSKPINKYGSYTVQLLEGEYFRSSDEMLLVKAAGPAVGEPIAFEDIQVGDVVSLYSNRDYISDEEKDTHYTTFRIKVRAKSERFLTSDAYGSFNGTDTWTFLFVSRPEPVEESAEVQEAVAALVAVGATEALARGIVEALASSE